MVDSETLPDYLRYATRTGRDVLEWFQAQGDRANLQMALAFKIYEEAMANIQGAKIAWMEMAWEYGDKISLMSQF